MENLILKACGDTRKDSANELQMNELMNRGTCKCCALRCEPKTSTAVLYYKYNTFQQCFYIQPATHT